MRSFVAAAVPTIAASTSLFSPAPAYAPAYSEALVYSDVPMMDYATYSLPPTPPAAAEQPIFGSSDVVLLAAIGAVVTLAVLGRSGSTAVAEPDLESATIAARVATLGVQGRSESFGRREALLGAASLTSLALGTPAPARADGYSVPPLTYNYSALEPYIDTDTMLLHHDAHHAAYVAKLNAQTEGKPAASILSLQADAKKAGLNNSAGGHYNHSMFWTTMAADSGGAPRGELGAAHDKAFGSVDKLKEQWSAASAGVFGSGWAWLVVTKGGDVAIKTTPNQDNPLMDTDGDIPILGIDVWEHAYYLRYKNKRPDYIAAFFNVISWPKVAEYYASAKAGKAIEF
jgi:Fe-Mn family superoxide dismutase